MTSWRTTAVGVALIAFALARIAFHPDQILNADTVAMVATGCSLILGTDRLLGFTKKD